MKFTFWAFILILLPVSSCSVSEKQTSGYSETLYVDSLLRQYNEDSVLMNPKSVIHTLSEAGAQITDSVNYYRLLLYIAKCHLNLHETDNLFALCDQILEFSGREKSITRLPSVYNQLTDMQADVYNTIALYFSFSGQLDSTLFYFEKSFNLVPHSDVCINLADSYHQKGDYVSAIKYYREVLFSIDSLGGGEKLYFAIFSGMAKTYQALDNFALAEQYYERAALYSENMPFYDKYFFDNSRGNFYYLTKEYEKAFGYFRSASRYAEMLLQPVTQAIPAANIGELYILLEQPDSARFYLNLAKDLFGNLFFEPQFNFYMTGLYASLAMLEGNLPEAETLLVRPYDTLSISPQYLYYHNKRMQDFYLSKQDFEKAYYYRMKAETYNDSIRSVKVRNNIAEIDARYSQDTTLLKKDILIALTENKALQWRNTTVATVALFVFFLLSVAGITFYIRKRNELRLLNQRATITGLRMEIVRNRLSPHFMFNALNLVMPSLGKYSELVSPFRLLIQLLRDNLVASEQIASPLQQEIERVQNFLQLQALKQTEQIRIDWLIMPDVPTDILVPSMSIQIPIENAVKYAFPPDTADAYLQILIKPETEAIGITIEDNGIGYHPDTPADRKKGAGSGLKMLRQTIELLNAKNSKKISFHIENKRAETPPGQGTRVYLHIPIHYNFEL